MVAHFDRRGPGKREQGFSCYCEWSSALHGNICPEHGCEGTAIPSALTLALQRIEELQDGHETYGNFTYAEAQDELKRRQENPGFAAEAWHYRIEEIK